VVALLASFVAVADEVGRLQRGGDPECDLFRSFCEQGHYGGRTVPTSTRQGIYAIAPSGRFLASVNSTQPDKVAAMLRTALAKWQELPEAERRLPSEQAKAIGATRRFEDRLPADGVVLAMYVRDLGREAAPRDWRTGAWNEDQAWFTKAEAESLVPAQPTPGAAVQVPARLVARLARLHLVDTVRGQAPPFPKDAVVAAELRSEVVRADGSRVHLRLAGRTHTLQKGRWVVEDRKEPVDHERGVRTELTGHAVFDREARRFVAFELLAIGDRWGATHYNGRHDDVAPSRIGFAFVLAGPDHPRVAPAFWWDYDLR
jgi:hypothetical protein